MECLYCGGKTQVVNSRPQKRLLQVWRRRSCTVCQAVFTTLEAVDLGGSLVVRDADGAVRPFSRQKLFISVHDCLKHRADALDAAEALTATVIASLRKRTRQPVVTRLEIITAAKHVLQRFDKAAAVQYDAYHRG